MKERNGRRDVLKLLGGVGAAVGLGVGLPAYRDGQGTAKVDLWPYGELDPGVVAESGYASFFEGDCMFGSFAGIVRTLSLRRAGPWDAFPLRLLGFGAGGVVGWGTLCGALGGGAMAIWAFSPEPRPLIDELFSWYSYTEQPSLLPSKPRIEIANMKQTISRSPLCHASVTRWTRATGYCSSSRERSERCARLTGAVAGKTVELLNAQLIRKSFEPRHPIPERVQACRSCHDKGGDVEYVKTKQDCLSCHGGKATGHPH